MQMLPVHLLFIVVVLACLHAACAQPTDGATRRLQEVEDSSVTGVRIADFSTLPPTVDNSTEYDVDKLQLDGTIDVSDISVSEGPTLFGTYQLGPAQVQLLAQAISSELDPIPASDAVNVPIVAFPGASMRGESVLDTLDTSQPLRIPTVFAPFYAGTVFSLEAREQPPATTLTFSNMTLLLPNTTYKGIHESGLLDFFDLGANSRFCFTNSILALQSCEGFTPNIFHMWCCTASVCNILYRQKALADLGFATAGGLDYLQCVSGGQDAHAPPAGASSEPNVQEADTTGVRVADFASLPANLTQEAEIIISETPLPGAVNIAASAGVPALWGAYSLGPAEVAQLTELVAATLVPISALDASKAPVVDFPGVTIRGESVLDTLSTQQPLRIPTVFAPFYAGTAFTVAGRETAPGVTLSFANMTLLLPNVTYAGIHESGLMDFFDLGASARFCFINSILVLQSCKGFTHKKYHMWCCSASQCNLLYTKQALADLGFDSVDTLAQLQCYAAEAPAATGQPPGAPGGGPTAEAAPAPLGDPEIISALSGARGFGAIAVRAACWAGAVLAVFAGDLR